MTCRTSVGLHGKTLLEYIPENEADLETIYGWMLDGTLPNAPLQKDPHPENAVKSPDLNLEAQAA